MIRRRVDGSQQLLKDDDVCSSLKEGRRHGQLEEDEDSPDSADERTGVKSSSEEDESDRSTGVRGPPSLRRRLLLARSLEVEVGAA
jgi:hypothetical protein|mmetsp:Transcript_11478/g.25269  ORF Transcript_11478/g.25269 Transcript_11478/m.25269 type:complete len:86 (-) Transcript_11478:133-390(-)